MGGVKAKLIVRVSTTTQPPGNPTTSTRSWQKFCFRGAIVLGQVCVLRKSWLVGWKKFHERNELLCQLLGHKDTPKTYQLKQGPSAKRLVGRKEGSLGLIARSCN